MFLSVSFFFDIREATPKKKVSRTSVLQYLSSDEELTSNVAFSPGASSTTYMESPKSVSASPRSSSPKSVNSSPRCSAPTSPKSPTPRPSSSATPYKDTIDDQYKFLYNSSTGLASLLDATTAEEKEVSSLFQTDNGFIKFVFETHDVEWKSMVPALVHKAEFPKFYNVVDAQIHKKPAGQDVEKKPAARILKRPAAAVAADGNKLKSDPRKLVYSRWYHFKRYELTKKGVEKSVAAARARKFAQSKCVEELGE